MPKFIFKNYYSINLIDLIDLYIFAYSKALNRLILKSFFVFLLFLNVTILAQDRVVSYQNVYWLRYYNQLALNSKLTFHSEFDTRKEFGTNQQQQAIFHARLFYQLPKNTEIAGGFTYSRQSSYHLGKQNISPEFRINQVIIKSNALAERLILQQRIWTESRFRGKDVAIPLFDSFDFIFRFRYRLQAAFQLNKPSNQLKTIARISDEVMLNAGKSIVYNHFDQNRISLSIEQNLNKHFSFEAQYFKILQKNNVENQFSNRNIVRLTLLHKIWL